MESVGQVDLVSVDLSKAFDRVDHGILLEKLRFYGIAEEVVVWIASWLCHRSHRVIIDGDVSDAARVLSGVPQGSVLGPLLFCCMLMTCLRVLFAQCTYMLMI